MRLRPHLPQCRIFNSLDACSTSLIFVLLQQQNGFLQRNLRNLVVSLMHVPFSYTQSLRFLFFYRNSFNQWMKISWRVLENMFCSSSISLFHRHVCQILPISSLCSQHLSSPIHSTSQGFPEFVGFLALLILFFHSIACPRMSVVYLNPTSSRTS